MAFVGSIPCCGVGEVRGLDNRGSIRSILRQAKNQRKGMLIAFFMKPRGKDKFKGEKFMEKLLSYGFQKSGNPFVNPNTGNTIQPLHYVLKKEEKANTLLRNGWEETFLDHPED